MLLLACCLCSAVSRLFNGDCVILKGDGKPIDYFTVETVDYSLFYLCYQFDHLYERTLNQCFSQLKSLAKMFY